MAFSLLEKPCESIRWKPYFKVGKTLFVEELRITPLHVRLAASLHSTLDPCLISHYNSCIP